MAAIASDNAADLSARQHLIIDFIREKGFASLEVMAQKFQVSQQTVRREVIHLSERGLLQRHYGGAGLPPGTDRLAYSRRSIRNVTEKAAIGRAVAREIPDGASLFIDIGTTTEAVAEALIEHKNLRIITNHVRVVSILCENTDFEIILSGGLVRNRDWAVTGETTNEFLRNFRVGYGIFGAGSITDDGQILDYDYRDSQASAVAREISRRKFVVVDHSKFNADAMMPFSHVSEVNAIFTDRSPPPPMREAIELAGVELFVTG